MKALEGANTEARVQVAEARNRGDVGEAEKQARGSATASLQHDLLNSPCMYQGHAARRLAPRTHEASLRRRRPVVAQQRISSGPPRCADVRLCDAGRRRTRRHVRRRSRPTCRPGRRRSRRS
jgi:hypothetical protein